MYGHDIYQRERERERDEWYEWYLDGSVGNEERKRGELFVACRIESRMSTHSHVARDQDAAAAAANATATAAATATATANYVVRTVHVKIAHNHALHSSSTRQCDCSLIGR